MHARHPSIHSHRPVPRHTHARMHSRDGRGRRCIHTVIPYIHTRYTRGVDSYSTDPRIGDKKNKMHARSVPRNVHTPWSVWVGRRTRHDTYIYTYSSLFHFICIYCPRSTYILQTRTTKRARPRHGWQSINRARVRAFVDATPRDRDWRRSSDDETGETNERTRSSSSSSPTRRDRESYTRASHRCRENPFIGRARDGKVNARGFISFIRSFVR